MGRDIRIRHISLLLVVLLTFGGFSGSGFASVESTATSAEVGSSAASAEMSISNMENPCNSITPHCFPPPEPPGVCERPDSVGLETNPPCLSPPLPPTTCGPPVFPMGVSKGEGATWDDDIPCNIRQNNIIR